MTAISPLLTVRPVSYTHLNDVFYVRIDKNRKIPITVFIRALGLGTDGELLDYFGNDQRIKACLLYTSRCV